MKTVKAGPDVLLPGSKSWSTAAFFEGASARKIEDLYYLVYPVRNGSGLHYATSHYPDRDFKQQGRIHSTSDFGINGHHLFNLAYPMGNNHGGMVCINGQWYIFDHRMTNRSPFSRQGVAEPITIETDGSIRQVESTSCGLNGGALKGEGTYPAYVACNLMSRKWFGFFRYPQKNPWVMQDGEDGDESTECYVSGLKNGFTAGYKYFDIADGHYNISVTVRGGSGKLTIATQEDEKRKLGTVCLQHSETWHTVTLGCAFPKSTLALFFTYHGNYSMEMLNILIEKQEDYYGKQI
jgi:arabinoxylan arabinofuranohydrolase